MIQLLRQQRAALALVAVALAGTGVTPAMAATTSSGAIPVSATVDQQLTMSITMLQKSSSSDPGTTVTSMNYGTLARPTNTDGTPAALRADKFFDVFIGMNTSGRPYTLTQTAAALTNSTGQTLPNGAWIVTPVQATPATGTVASRGSAVGTSKLLYTSNTSGQSVTVEATYGITNDPALGATQFIPPDQASGTYTSNVTFTLTTS